MGSGKLIITHGVRPKGSEDDDQKRIATPRFTIQNGADHIVVRRQILRSSIPKKAAQEIVSEING